MSNTITQIIQINTRIKELEHKLGVCMEVIRYTPFRYFNFYRMKLCVDTKEKLTSDIDLLKKKLEALEVDFIKSLSTSDLLRQIGIPFVDLDKKD